MNDEISIEEFEEEETYSTIEVSCEECGRVLDPKRDIEYLEHVCNKCLDRREGYTDSYAPLKFDD